MLDLAACTGPASAEGGGCWTGLVERHEQDVPLCLAVRGAGGDQTLPLWLHRETGASTPAAGSAELALPGPGARLEVKLFYLRASAGGPVESCVPESFDVERACRVEAGCLLASAAVEVDVVSSGGIDLVWGPGGQACVFECGDASLCGAAEGAPAAELCDGRDNDCDGQIDEDPRPPAVACNDGAQGVCLQAIPRCAAGAWACVLPRTYEAEESACDGLDNDCDGDVDEGLGLDVACEAGEGACQRAGTVVCSYDGGTRCDAVPGEPAVEECNGADDDCDGDTDEGCNDCADGYDLPEDWSCLPQPEPAGYAMGSPEEEPGRDEDETRHVVVLTQRLLAGQTEVTQRQWEAIFGAVPAYFVNCGPDCPVERVSWFDALEYLNRRSVAEGLTPCYTLEGCSDGDPSGGCEGARVSCDGDWECESVAFAGPAGCDGYRLPTEAEWEWSARGGTESAVYTGGRAEGGEAACGPVNALDGAGGYCGNAGGSTHPGADQDALADVCNAWWLCDVHGNVSEWVWDAFRQDYGGLGTQDAPVVDPVGPSRTDFRVLRGGSWRSEAPAVRAADRVAADPRIRRSYVGFRAVRTLP